jgi:protein arginine kinase
MKLQLEDRVWRSAGTLSYARSISTDEAMQLLSDIRMGSSLGLIEADLEKLNSLLWEIQPANLIKASGKDTLTPEERDIRRAALLRKLPIR